MGECDKCGQWGNWETSKKIFGFWRNCCAENSSDIAKHIFICDDLKTSKTEKMSSSGFRGGGFFNTNTQNNHD